MVPLLDLWLAIVVAAVAVFFASSIIHMVLPLHRADYGKLPGEAAVLGALRGEGVTPGDYMFPCAASMKDMGTPEMMEKFKEGPVGFMTVLPNGPPNIGKSLGQWFIYLLVIGIGVAYVAGRSLGPGAEFMDVFRMSGAVAMLAYAAGQVPASIWQGRNWGSTFRFVLDGVIYGLATGAVFGGLWPAAV